MQAVICPKYGPPEILQIAEVPKPKPKKNEVCVKVYTTTVSASDTFIRGYPLPLRLTIAMRIGIGFTKPRKRVIGLVFSGEVDSVGDEVTQFEPGQLVYGFTGFRLGAYAEYTCIGEDECIAPKPSNASHAEAVGIAYGGLLAWQYLDHAKVRNAKTVMVYGASSSTGTFAVQLAKHFGAEVTGVCSTRNLELVQSLGVDHVLDYTQQDTLATNLRYDVVLDAVGKWKSSALKEQAKSALTPTGRYVSIDDGALKLHQYRLKELTTFMEEGNFHIVIDKTYPLTQIAEAHRYVEQGHKRGNVVVTVI